MISFFYSFFDIVYLRKKKKNENNENFHIF